jgi:hypothetical protein
MDLFNNPVGYRTSPCKMLRILLFLAEFVQKLQFLNNSNEPVPKSEILELPPIPAIIAWGPDYVSIVF